MSGVRAMDETGETACLVRRAMDGDRAAFAALLQLHERTALAVAYAAVGCAATAADVAQEAFLKAWQRLGELDEPARFGPWLARIVRNLAIDCIRRKPRAQTDPEMLAVVPAADAEDRLELDERRQKMNAAIAELDELTRMAVTLRYYENLSSRQIGELIDLSPAAVDMRLSRARTVLREKLAYLAGMIDTVSCAGGEA